MSRKREYRRALEKEVRRQGLSGSSKFVYMPPFLDSEEPKMSKSKTPEGVDDLITEALKDGRAYFGGSGPSYLSKEVSGIEKDYNELTSKVDNLEERYNSLGEGRDKLALNINSISTTNIQALRKINQRLYNIEKRAAKNKKRSKIALIVLLTLLNIMGCVAAYNHGKKAGVNEFTEQLMLEFGAMESETGGI